MNTPNINRDELSSAIIELNSMSRAEGIIMTHDGHIKTGNTADEECLCMLIPAAKLAQQLTSDGLSSYTGKELKSWADAYDCSEIDYILSNL